MCKKLTEKIFVSQHVKTKYISKFYAYRSHKQLKKFAYQEEEFIKLLKWHKSEPFNLHQIDTLLTSLQITYNPKMPKVNSAVFEKF